MALERPTKAIARGEMLRTPTFAEPLFIKPHEEIALQLTGVLVASIPPTLASVFVKALATHLPIKHLHHLKRIRKPAGAATLDIIICEEGRDVVSQPIVELLTLHQLDTHVVQVPAQPPPTRAQLPEWSAVWPTSWKVPEGRAMIEPPVDPDTFAWWKSLMSTAIAHAQRGGACSNYAIIADPRACCVIGEAAGGTDAHPLHHPVMLAINAASVNEEAGWLRQGEVFHHHGRASAPQAPSTTPPPAGPLQALTSSSHTPHAMAAAAALQPATATSLLPVTQPSNLSPPPSNNHHAAAAPPPPPQGTFTATGPPPSALQSLQGRPSVPFPLQPPHPSQPPHPANNPTHPDPPSCSHPATSDPYPPPTLPHQAHSSERLQQTLHPSPPCPPQASQSPLHPPHPHSPADPQCSKRPKLSSTPPSQPPAVSCSGCPLVSNHQPPGHQQPTPSVSPSNAAQSAAAGLAVGAGAATPEVVEVAAAAGAAAQEAVTPAAAAAAAAAQDPRSRQYLCTGFDCIVVREPCSMCAMALVHSRVQRVVWCLPARGGLGVLGSSMRMHGLKSLNHHYHVFQLPLAG